MLELIQHKMSVIALPVPDDKPSTSTSSPGVLSG